MHRTDARLLLVAIALLAGCSATPAAPAASSGGSCTIPPHVYADLQACTGSAEQISLDVAKSTSGKTTSKIVIASKDPQTILSAMGAWAATWSTGANSFTVFAYGSKADYDAGSPYNRGQIFWNDGGPITVKICTSFEELGGVDGCAVESTYTVANR